MNRYVCSIMVAHLRDVGVLHSASRRGGFNRPLDKIK
jgi:hypothetical protein